MPDSRELETDFNSINSLLPPKSGVYVQYLYSFLQPVPLMTRTPYPS